MALTALAGAEPVLAQSAGREAASAAGLPLPMELPGFAPDAGKSRPFVIAPAPPPATGCAGALDCRLRVIGAVQHNGAVELNAAVLKW